jgi:predicted negative regulator of RcsB-dependent stress response
VARITRKELKTDKFALEVEHTVDFFEDHRQELVCYGGIALGVAVLIAGYMIYAGREHVARETALAHAIEVQEAGVGGMSATGGLTFPTQEAKDKEAIKVFSDLKNKYSGSMEAEVAQYYLGSILADQGKLAQAEKSFQEAAEKGDARYSSLAKLSLAQIYFSDGRDTQGESMLRDLMKHPTVFVSSEQATITLAKYLAIKKPAEARKLLEPLRTQPGPVGQIALNMLGEMNN